MAFIEALERRIVGSVDTHKDLHVAAVVDEQYRVLGTHGFATTRQGYRQMLAWMRSLGDLQRIGVKSTGSYGAGLLRFMQQAEVVVLEGQDPDRTGSPPARQERRSRLPPTAIFNRWAQQTSVKQVICFRLERLPGGARTPWKAPALSRRTR